jgi:uncharacterized OB-fold protein
VSVPVPVPHGVLPETADPRFARFWTAARECRLEIPRCAGCDGYVWPPRPICPRCLGNDLRWVEAGTRGEVYTWTVVHHATVETMPGPYIVVVVSLTDAPGVRLLGNMWTIAGEELAIGLPVEAVFDDVGEGVTLVNWRPFVKARDS